MSDILEELCALRRADAEESAKTIPYETLIKQIGTMAAPRDFRDAFFRGGGVRILAELKKASPSEGLIRADFDAVELARGLERAGAATLSVLCEPHRFRGGRVYLSAVRGAVDLPLLCKDFITTPYQVAAARAAGADAILLIVAVLPDEQLLALRQLAHDFGMVALVETHTAEEIRRAVDIGCEIIGVNCRDLRTFHTDPAITESLVGTIPADRTRIAESGIRTSDDIRRLQAAGADGFLIGTALMKEDRPADKLRELLI